MRETNGKGANDERRRHQLQASGKAASQPVIMNDVNLRFMQMTFGVFRLFRGYCYLFGCSPMVQHAKVCLRNITVDLAVT